MYTRGMTTQNIIAEATIDGCTITIEATTDRRSGRPIFIVHEAKMGYVSTWDITSTEKAARASANRLWTRRAGREKMIVCS